MADRPLHAAEIAAYEATQPRPGPRLTTTPHRPASGRPTPGGAGGKIGEISDSVEWYKRICARVVDIFVERAEGKITKAAFKKRWERQDWWLDSAEALKLGIVDEIG